MDATTTDDDRIQPETWVVGRVPHGLGACEPIVLGRHRFLPVRGRALRLGFVDLDDDGLQPWSDPAR